jgi:hypothetical protein
MSFGSKNRPLALPSNIKLAQKHAIDNKRYSLLSLGVGAEEKSFFLIFYQVITGALCLKKKHKKLYMAPRHWSQRHSS